MESFKAALQKHIRGGSDVFDYVSEMTSGGRTKYILIRGAAQRDRRGNPVLVFGSFEDITEKMRFSELKEASEFTRILMDSIPHPICCKGPDLKYMACNMAFELLFSATAEEIKGKTAADFLSPEDAAETFEIDRKLLRRGGMAANERRLFLPTLGERIVIETKSVFYDGGGAVGGIISCDIDITERKQAELALRESEERFRIVAEFSTEMIYWLDSAGVIRYISPNCAELTGFSAEEFVADPLLLEKMVVGEDSGCLCEFKLNTGARASVDVRVRSKDGVVKWMRHSCKPVLGDGGAPMGCRGSFSDITMLKHLEVELTRARDKLEDRVFAATKELKDVNRHLTEEIHLRRLTEESLRLSEQRFRTIAEASPIALLITSISSGAILFANDQALQLFKVDPANLTLTKPVSHYCCPEDRKNLLDEVVKTGKIDNREVRFKRTDGSVFTGAVSMKTAWFQGERAVFAGLTDITEQKITESSLAMTINELQNEMLARGRAEDALRESERRHRALAETAPVGIWQLDSDSRITFINPKMTEMLALDAAGAALGKSSFDFVGKNSLEAVRSARDRNFGGDSYDYEAELLPCSGSAVSALVSGKNILSRSGDILMRIEIFTDITARKIAEREAEQRRLQLIQADKMISLGILVAGVAHEINNPVNFIMLNAPILKEIWRDSLPAIINYHGENPNFSPAGLSFDEMMSITPSLFKGIEEGVDRIRSIVSGLKNYAKRDSNELNEKISVNDVVHSSMLLLSNMIKKSTRNLKLSLAEDMPRVNGNFQRLEQVVINIVQNACQALPAPDKGIKISTSFLRAENKIFLTVEDQGVGIPEDNLAFVKDPFFTTKRDSGGTGLGLSISESIIKEHGGELAVSSRPGQGAEVKIWLPASAWEES
jgi:PAS domain S-box-containing protein